MRTCITGKSSHSSVFKEVHKNILARARYAGQHAGSRMQTAVFDKFKDIFFLGKSGQADEGAQMVRIDQDSTGGLGGTSEEVLGPLAVLLVGFFQPEFESFRAMMTDLEADMVKLVPATPAIMLGTLQQAMASEFPSYQQPPLGQRRVVFFSGMYGSEVAEVIAAYRESGLPPCVFAAAVPNNWQRTVQDLVDSVWEDHAAMMSKLQQQQQEQGQQMQDDR